MKEGLAALLVALAPLSAWAHPQGFHKKLAFTLTKYGVQGLVVMDIDGGERCSLIRSGADANHDGVLSAHESGLLKKRLVALATSKVKLAFSGAPIALEVKESKINLHEDPRVGEGGLSVAILVDLVHPHDVREGMNFEVEDTAPDLSPVNLEVFQVPATDAGALPPYVGELASGEKVQIRLGALAEHR